MANIDTTLQQILSSMNAMHTKMDNLMADLSSTKQRVTVVEDDLREAYREIFKLKESVNSADQKSRSLTVRVFGLPISNDEKDGDSKAVAKTAYDRLFKPILQVAKEKNLVPTVPTIANVIADAFRLKPRNAAIAKPPPIVIRLVSSHIKTNIFKCKRDGLPEPSPAEVNSGILRFHLAEDLTPDSYGLLTDLRAHEKVERAWSTEGNIRFTKKGDSFVHKVKCIYDSIDTIVN